MRNLTGETCISIKTETISAITVAPTCTTECDVQHDVWHKIVISSFPWEGSTIICINIEEATQKIECSENDPAKNQTAAVTLTFYNVKDTNTLTFTKYKVWTTNSDEDLLTIKRLAGSGMETTFSKSPSTPAMSAWLLHPSTVIL